MKDINTMISVMQAYADGEKIEYRKVSFEATGWEDTNAPVWDWNNYDYRIKSEPRYRPYANAEECFADVQKHGGWMKHPTTEARMFITWVNPDHILCGVNIYEFAEMMESYVWADDGSVCGVLEE